MSQDLFGERTPDAFATRASIVEVEGQEDVLLPDVHLFYNLFEIPMELALRRLPTSVHPSIPGMLSVTFWRAAKSAFGAFELACVGIACRTGIKPRHLMHAAFVDNEAAAGFLRTRYGFPCRLAAVRQRESYDRIVGTVECAGRTILEVESTSLLPIVGGGSFVKVSPALNLAQIGGAPALLQLEASYEFKRVLRGAPRATVFDAEELGDALVRPAYPVSGTHAIVDLTLHPVRYALDLDRPAEQGGVRALGRAA